MAVAQCLLVRQIGRAEAVKSNRARRVAGSIPRMDIVSGLCQILAFKNFQTLGIDGPLRDGRTGMPWARTMPGPGADVGISWFMNTANVRPLSSAPKPVGYSNHVVVIDDVARGQDGPDLNSGYRRKCIRRTLSALVDESMGNAPHRSFLADTRDPPANI